MADTQNEETLNEPVEGEKVDQPVAEEGANVVSQDVPSDQNADEDENDNVDDDSSSKEPVQAEKEEPAKEDKADKPSTQSSQASTVTTTKVVLNSENLPNFKTCEKFGAKNLKSEEEAMIDYLSKVKDLTNDSNLKLNTIVKVTVVDRVATGTYTKSLFCKEIIAFVINNKIGNIKFTNNSRATSFIALVRDLTKKDYGATITNAIKCKIIKYVIDGNGLDIK